VALAHHDAAHGDQGSRGESELFGAQQCGNHDVASSLELAVRLEADAATKIVENQHLLSFRQTQFPGRAGVFDGGQRTRTRAAVMPRDQDHVRVCLGDTRRNRAHTHFGDEFHRNARPGIHVLQIVNELRQILDGIDVVVRRRRDEPDTRDGMPNARDRFVHLVAWKLAALAGLSALRDLDLEFVGVDQVFGRYTESPARHLLD
jgi:hypothetical protein